MSEPATQPPALNDETGVPVKWVFGILGAAFGLVVAAALGLVFIGALSTRLANAEKAVDDIQADRTFLVRARQDKDIALEKRLTSMETKLDTLLDRIPEKR